MSIVSKPTQNMNAVFDTSKNSRDINPFSESPRQRQFYHPSVTRQVDEMTMTQAALSVERKSWESSMEKSPNDDNFLKASLYYTSRLPTSDGVSPGGGGSSKLNESWPDSEKPSTLSVSGNASFIGELRSPQSQFWTSSPMSVTEISSLRDKLHRDQVPEKDTATVHGLEKTDGSVLSKYIDRFRHGTPLSREEREKKGSVKSRDFWWLSAESVRGSYEGLENGHLEEKADRLLQRTASSIGSSEPVVSTDGLGSSLSVTPRSLPEEPYRPAFTRTAFTERDGAGPLPRRRPPPEDDILVQWRLRCRMEDARQSASQIKPVSFVSKMDESTDSRLADFRRRLASGRLLDASGVTIDRSPSGLEQQTTEALVEIIKGHHGTAVTANHVPIASPSLPPGTLAAQREETVARHLHLSCDVLQCAHGDKLSGTMQRTDECQRGSASNRAHIPEFDRSQRGDGGYEMSHHPNGLPSHVETDHTIDKTHRGSGDHHKITGHLVPHKDTAEDSDEHRRFGSGDHGTRGADRIRGMSGEFIGPTDASRLKHKSNSVHASEDQQWQKDSGKDELVQPDENYERLKNMAVQHDMADNKRDDDTRDRHAMPERDMHQHLTAAKHMEETKSSQQKKRRPKRNGRLLDGETQMNSVDSSATDGVGHTYNKHRPITNASKKKASRRNSGQPRGADTERLPTLRQLRHSNVSQDDSGRQSLCQPARSRASPTPCVASAVGQVVGSQLFGSSASLTSSIDSSDDRCPSASPPDLATALWSDSEEFADDEVLVDLRNRRAAYLQKLANVNRLLEQPA